MTFNEYLPFIDHNCIRDIKRDFLNNYSYLIDKSILTDNPLTENVIVNLSDQYSAKELDFDNDRFEFIYKKKAEVNWLYSYQNGLGRESKHIKFDFQIIGYINVIRNNSYSYEILDPIKNQLRELQELRNRFKEKLEIPSLYLYRSEYLNTDFISKFVDVSRRIISIRPFHDYHFANDLIYSTQHLSNTLAEIELYKPNLYNFLDEKIHLGSKEYFSYNLSFYDKQYYFLASTYIQLLYNHWDKIGDLIYYFFDVGISNERNVYFSTVIKGFPENFKSEHFNWLNNFYLADYEKINSERQEVVHYTSLESKIFRNHMDSHSDVEKISELQNWKTNLPIIFKDLYIKSIQGVEKAMQLIESKT